jgi:hypothetical protein
MVLMVPVSSMQHASTTTDERIVCVYQQQHLGTAALSSAR